MAKLLYDANISYRIKKKVDFIFRTTLHVTDTDLPVPAKDTEIWEWAKANDYIIVSYDEDFEFLSSLRGFPPKVILLRIGNQSTQFIADLLLKSADTIEVFCKNQKEGLLEIIYK